MTTLHPSELSAQIDMGVTELFVNDLNAQREFYCDLVGLPVINEGDDHILLGFEEHPAVLLSRISGLRLPNSKSAGLYHVAILFEHRAALAKSLWRILRLRPELFQGSADHLVSEAFYFADPEGNGVELYADRDPSTWIWENGNVQMASAYIDVQNFIAQHASLESPSTSKVGHVHLKVGSIPTAKQFYLGVLGFHLTAEMTSALFLSDGRYHHHIGLNTWESQGAMKREPSLGLGKVQMQLANGADLSKLKQRLNDVVLPYKVLGNALHVQDPWGNALVFDHKS